MVVVLEVPGRRGGLDMGVYLRGTSYVYDFRYKHVRYRV